jgi:hypothetical protein
MGDKTIHTVHTCVVVLYSSELSGRGNLCDEEGKILHSVSINKANNRVHNEMS